MIAIGIDNLSLSFGTKRILDGVSFSLEDNDRLGVIGVNGCGKSTLFKLITAELTPDSGAVHISKGKSVGILRQDDAFLDLEGENGSASALEVMYHAFPELLAAEARLLSLQPLLSSGNEAYVKEYSTLHERFIAQGGLEFRNRCASTLLKMGFDAQEQKRPICDFSGGQRTRLALSRQLCREPDILMLDEPTNHLDMETLGWLEGFLASYKKCLMIISHDRFFLDRITNKTLHIENCKAKLYNGGYSKSMAQRKVDREIALKHYKNQQKEIARQEAYIAQQRAWNRERNIIAAESRLKLLEKMERVERVEDSPEAIRIKFSSAPPSGNEVLRVRELCFSYGSKPLINKMSFTVFRKDRLFLVGPNGSGKSTLIKLILEKLTPGGGYLEWGYNILPGYYDQENQELTPTKTVLDELWDRYPSCTELEIRNLLARFNFFGDDVYKSVGELSGGERARLTLSKLILAQTNLLILDEPTNHLDIDSREALEEALEGYDGTVIIVSHDRYFIEKLSTRLIDIDPASPAGYHDIIVSQAGRGYDELCLSRASRTPVSVQSAAPASSSGKEQYLRNKKETADRRNAQKRLERLRAEAEKLEQRIEELDAEINGDAATDYTRLAVLDEEKTRLEERLLEIYGEI